MSKNLRHEMRNAVIEAFGEHKDKHDLKQKERAGVDVGEHVFGYTSKKNLLRFIDVFCKETGVKKRSQITPAVCDRFITRQVTKGSTQGTIDTYRSYIRKFGRLFRDEQSWQAKDQQAVRKVSGVRGAADVPTREDMDKIIAYCERHPNTVSACIIRLEREIGVRVSDMAYGTRLSEDGRRLIIVSKGGKTCSRDVTPQISSMIASETFQKLFKDGKLVCPKDNSLNTFLRRLCDSEGITRHSFHSIRRFVAQEKYDSFRNEFGFTYEQAIFATSKWLNHSTPRERMLLQSYIKP